MINSLFNARLSCLSVAKLRNNAETEGLQMFLKTSQMGSETFGKSKYTFGKQLIAFYLSKIWLYQIVCVTLPHENM